MADAKVLKLCTVFEPTECKDRCVVHCEKEKEVALCKGNRGCRYSMRTYLTIIGNHGRWPA